MFNVGGGELLVIFLVALIVLGPQRLPGAARSVGRAMGELRRVSNGFQRELRDAFEDAELSTDPRATSRRDPVSLSSVVADLDRGDIAEAPPPSGAVAPEVADAIDQVTAAPAAPAPAPDPAPAPGPEAAGDDHRQPHVTGRPATPHDPDPPGERAAS